MRPKSRAPPASHSCPSVKVLAPSCAEADALATGLLVLGRERGLPLAERLAIPVLFVERAEGGQFIDTASSIFPAGAADSAVPAR